MKIVNVDTIRIGAGNPIVGIIGLCVIENMDHTREVCTTIKKIAEEVGIKFIFKASFDKANRSSIKSYRGPGIDIGLEILQRVKTELSVPVLTDVHTEEQVHMASEVVDVLQIPAFLCRQTDLLIAAAKTGKVVNIKKGQFLSPWDTRNIIEKITSTGNEQILLTERGASFGYNYLISDMRSLVVMREFGYPVVYDVTHSVQVPGGIGEASGGERKFVPYLARAGTAIGIDAIFLEVHNTPDQAPSDGMNALRLDDLKETLSQVVEIDAYVKRG